MDGRGKVSHTVVGIVLLLLLLGGARSRSWGQDGERIGTVLAVEGQAEVHAQDKTEWERLRFRDAIFLQDTVRTGAASKLKVLLRNDSILTLSEQSEMAFTEFLLTPLQQRSIMNLLFGTVKVITMRIFGTGSGMEVRTPNAIAGIRGTTFVVRFIPPDSTDVFVFEGTLTVRNLDPAIPGVVSIPPNTRTSISGKTAPTAPIAITPAESQTIEREVQVIEQVPAEVAPTQELAPLEAPRGTESAPGVEGAIEPDSTQVVVSEVSPVTAVESTVVEEVEAQSENAVDSLTDRQTESVTPDTSPPAQEVIERSIADVIVNFPGR